MTRAAKAVSILLAVVLTVIVSCQPAPTGKKSIVVTYSVLGSLVQELVGDAATVTVPMPNGLDPHEWEPSAKDIEAFNKADLVVENGLGLEGGLGKTLDLARSREVKFFTASDHVTVRHVGAGEGIPSGDPDQAVGAADPHLWTDPMAMKSVVLALAPEINRTLGLDVGQRATDLAARLDQLDAQVKETLSAIPEADRKLVTGHESMGYFAQHYVLKLVGLLIPSLSSQAGVSASDLASTKQRIIQAKVKAIFTEVGTPAAVANAIGQETGVKVVGLTTHALPSDGSYFTFMNNMAATIAGALK